MTNCLELIWLTDRQTAWLLDYIHEITTEMSDVRFLEHLETFGLFEPFSLLTTWKCWNFWHFNDFRSSKDITMQSHDSERIAQIDQVDLIRSSDQNHHSHPPTQTYETACMPSNRKCVVTITFCSIYSFISVILYLHICYLGHSL